MASADSGIPPIGELRARLDAAGIHPVRRLGQNFLIDKNLIHLSVRAAELDGQTLAVEVGTGPATLTRGIATEAGWVLSIELDRNLVAFARRELHDVDNVTLMEGDALAGKSEINPELLAEAERLRREHGLTRTAMVANLPYNIATPLIADLLLTDTTIERYVVTVQQEVADRLISPPGSKDYGWVSVLVAAMCDVKVVRKLGPHVFWPRPKVQSAILKFDRRDLGPSRQEVLDAVAVLRNVFNHRRKKIRHILNHQVGLDDDAIAALEDRFPLDERCDKLSPKELLALATAAGREG